MRKDKLLTQAQKNSERLKLTEEQKPAFKAILDKYAKIKHQINTSNLSLKKRQDSIESLSEPKDAEVKLLLTAEQFKTYKEIVAERKQRLDNARKTQLKLPEKQ